MSDEPTTNPDSGSDEQTSNDEVQAGSSEGQVESGGEFSAGGKDFGNLEELRNAYAELQKGFTKKTQDHSEFRKGAEQNRRAIEQIRNTPGLSDQIRGYLQRDQQRQGQQRNQQRQGPPGATPLSGGLSDVDEQRMARMELQFETQNLRSQHPELSDENLRDVYQLAADMSDKWDADVPLEDAYTKWAWENKGAELYQKGLTDKEAEIRKGRAAGTTQAVSGGERTRPKFDGNAPGNERRSYIDSLLKREGIDLSGFDRG